MAYLGRVKIMDFLFFPNQLGNGVLHFPQIKIINIYSFLMRVSICPDIQNSMVVGQPAIIIFSLFASKCIKKQAILSSARF